MASGDGRGFARIHLTIWDGDFTELAAPEQLVYLMLLSSRDLSYCGVAPLLPKRLVLMTQDLTERRVFAALKTLAEHRHIVVDEETAEVPDRTYVRHDGILKQPNLVRAMNKAYDKVHSGFLRETIRDELSKAIVEGFPEGLPQGIEKALREGFAAPDLEAYDGIPSTFHLPPSTSVVASPSKHQSVTRKPDAMPRKKAS